MSTLQCVTDGKPATLHVFAQDGAWQWGITVPRGRGAGFQVVSYSERNFVSESDAMSDGSLTLNRITGASPAESAGVISPLLSSIGEDRRRYMHERLRCAMARLMASDEAHAARATRWVTAWGALIGDQYFDKAVWKRHRDANPSE